MTSSFYSDVEILKRVKVGEDSFVERKSFGDWKKDAVKTSVAFANSCPFEAPPGLLCIGVRDDGTVETSEQDLDRLQKTLERELEEAYPPVPHHTRIVPAAEGKFIAVIIPGSSQVPHFSGPAYVRSGPTTIKANEEQFERVVDRRERKVREILKWQNKRVKLVRIWAAPTNLSGRIAGEADVVVLGHDPQTGSITFEVPQG